MALVFGESGVNTFKTSNQQSPDIAVLSDGSYVIVWTSYTQDAENTWGVYGQRFTSKGVPLGPEFRVNTTTPSTQDNAHVAALSTGGFIVTWDDSSGEDGSGQGILGQRFSSAGAAQGGEFIVNPTTSSTQNDNGVAGYTSGFATVWASSGNAGGSGQDIYLRRFDNNGVQVTGETLVSTVPGAPGTAQSSTQYQPEVAAYANGNLVIVWTDQVGNDGSSYGVYGRTYNAAAGTFSDTFLVNTTTAGAQYEPSVATLSDGSFVVVWRSDSQDGSSAGVYGQRFTAAGAKAGGEFLVNQSTVGGQYQPSVTGLSTGGFVVTWYNDNYDVGATGTTADVYVREYSNAGVALTGQVKLVSLTNSGSEYEPAIADLGQGNFVVAYSDYDNLGNNTYEIGQQLFGDAAELARQLNPTVGDFAGTVTFDENLVNATPQVIDPAVSVSDLDSADFAGGKIDLYYVQDGQATDQLGVRNQGTGFGQIGTSGANVSFGGANIGTIAGGTNGSNLVITLNATATVEAVEALIQNLTYASTSQSPGAQRTVGLRLSDGDGGASVSSTVTINVTPSLDGVPAVHGEEVVNTFQPSTQGDPDVATLADGSYVVVWNSYDQDTSNTYGVFGQRFSANGTPLGGEFRVNSNVAGAQDEVHVASSGTGFVVTWTDATGLDGSGQGVFSQRYDAGGVAQGVNTVVSTTTSSIQYQNNVAGYTAGHAVVWVSVGNAGSDGYDVYLRRFDTAGTAVTGEVRISTTPGNPADAQNGTQQTPDVAAYANGNLVIVWTDHSSNDGSSYGVYGRTVSAAGVLSDSFLVNTTITSNQYEPAVATLSDGGFIVVWRSTGQDGSSEAVYGQRYNAAGTKTGSEFLVNESTTGGQYQPAVTGLSTGGFVVSWYNDNFDVGGAGTTADVYVREYNAAGQPIDGQRKLVSGTNSTESDPAIADLGSGNFVVVYQDYDNSGAAVGNNTYRITQQLFGTPAELPRQANPSLGDFVGSVTFNENLVNATPQVIDAAVSLEDTDSANLAGGRVDLFYVQGGDATDQLGVRNQGIGAGQVGVSGSNVTYGNVTIGSIAAAPQNGANGAGLVINLNSNATVEAVEAVIQNLTYGSSSQNPAALRTVGLRVSDGDGGSSVSSTVAITVTPELEATGAPLVHGESYVNTYPANTQDAPKIAVLGDGSYVVIWDSESQDGSSTGIYGQRYTNAGVAIGTEFKVNTATSSQQDNASVAALSNGGFVVTWEDSSGVDTSGQGVIAQRYTSAGVADGANTIVNTSVSSVQYQASVAGYTGGYGVVWVSAHSGGGADGYDVYLRRFDNAGNQTLAETRVSTTPGNPADAQNGTQQQANVAAYSNGNLVIIWLDHSGNDGASYGIYGRTVTAAGVFSDTFLVNTTTTGNQYEPSVATLSDGGFVVVWRSDEQDGNSAGVYGQRYNSAGVKAGGEFLVNETTTGGQYQAAVSGLSTGGFVVTWYNDNYDVTGVGTTTDVYVREYNAAGTAIDGQRKLVSASNSTEQTPTVADLGSGNFVVAYSDYNNTPTGGFTYDIAQQHFGTAAELARPSAAPVLDDVRILRTLTSGVADPNYAGNAQLIDADVLVSDSDSANFSGGQLTIQFLTASTATEALGIRNLGGAPGQIGTAGATVNFGGVAIGSFTGGGAGGAALVVTLNASATAAAVRALVENLTYQNTAPPAGTTDRYVGIYLTDGDGGAAAPSAVQLRIQATFAPTTIVLDDVVDSVTFTESQANAGAVVDSALQLDYVGATGFNNGKLLAQFISSTGRVDDQLSIRNEGGAAGQVGVAGNVVSYGGTAIGTISATLNGVNGVNLEVTFNASATADAIERVAEALVYTNTSEAPNPTRTLRLTVSDGANVTSAVQDIDIAVTAEADAAAALALLGEQQTNTYEEGQQTDAVVARLQGANNGGYVIAWVSEGGQDGSVQGVFAQRYTANGSAVGPEFQVNSQTQGTQTQPAIAGLAGGGFVISWTDHTQDGSSYGVYAQRYDVNGAPAGSEFQVNTSTLATQYEPAIVGLAGGGFVVAFRSDYTANAANYDVLAQRYDASGVAQGAEFTINTQIASTQYQPQLSTLSTGGFVSVWSSAVGDANGYGVLAQRFDATGNKVGGEIAVNTATTGNQLGTDVAGIAAGGFVAVWHYNNNVYAQRFDASGNKLGSELLVSTVDVPANISDYTRVAALESGGFVVTWAGSASAFLGGSGWDVFTQKYDASGNKIDGPTLVNSTVASTQYLPDVAALTGSNYVVAWSGYDNEQNGVINTYGVYHQLFGAAGAITRGVAPLVTDVSDSVTFLEDAVNAGPQIIDAGISVTDTDSANFDGGRLWVSVISGYGDILQAQLPENLVAQDQLGIRNQGNTANLVGVSGANVSYGGTLIGTIVTTGANGTDLVVQFNASASAQAVEAVIENLTYANTSSAPVAQRTVSISVSDGDGATSVPRVVQINVTPEFDGAQPLFGNEIVNTYRPGTQDNSALGKLSDGGYVVVWQSQDEQDGWSNSVHGQRYDAKGVAVGSEFQVNTYTPYQQQQPSVAGLSGGGWVVMWQSYLQDGGDYGIYGQRYDANGVPQGAEFLVNTSAEYAQSEVSVTALASGGFVATWNSYYQNGVYYDIYAQRFDGSGAKVGSEFKVNTDAANYQYTPSVTTLADGSFVVVWRSDTQDGNSGGVYAQRYNATGVAQGAEFKVNSFTDSNQFDPQVVSLSGGGFVVVWTSTSQDGGASYGVFAQRYNAAGVAQGSEFRVNTNTAGNEHEPSVTALSTGGFAVAFTDDGRITVQQFDVNGIRVDGETLVDTHDNNGSGSAPAVLGLASGAFVVTWTDYDYAAGGGDNTYQVWQQIFGNPALITRQANPELVDVAPSVTFAENTINAVPQLIDPGVGLFDPDSANFDGGVLEVNYLTDYGALDQLGFQGLDNQDQLGIRNEGNGAGQVGVSGSTVSFAGTAIGTIVSNGANGDKLTVLFNANATPDAVEQVIENLSYANTVSNPIASRTVSIRVTDGDGGASAARTVTINVTSEIDGAVKVGLERIVNATRGGDQYEPSVAELTSGGYVVVWQDQGANDGSSHGVYGQRYDANDNAAGAEFRVNTFTTGAQYEPQVTGLTGGGYVVVWRSDNQDGSSAGVYAQRYNADGSTAGAEFLVNTTTGQGQYSPQIDATTDGGFVVTWYYDYYNATTTELGDIFFQRYNASGVAQGVETRANPAGLGNNYQYQPDIAWNADGSGFVVVWRDDLGDGAGSAVKGQRFDATGATQGASFQINSYTASTQEQPSVAALKGGGFIVVWESEGQDLSSTGVYGQRYDAAGVKVGAEFRVNTYINSVQNDPQVAATENGGWVVTWTDYTNPQDASSYGVFAQQYNAAGLAIDGDTLVNTYKPSTQQMSSVTGMADGGFVVAYASYFQSGDGDGDGVADGGNNTYEIRVQRFSNTAPNISDIALNANEEQTVVLSYDFFDSGFNDPDGQALQAIKIVTLPAEGTLRLNGVAVNPNDEISEADLKAGLLTYQGDVDYFGLDQFRWTGSDGIAFAATPVFTNINIQNLNDGPRLEAGANDTAAEGAFFSHVVTLNDPDPEGHQITVNWGDGTAPQVFNVGNNATHSISHYYYENATYTVTVIANDQQGQANSSEVDSFQVVVSNVAPTISLFGNASVVQGETYTLDLGNPFDPANSAGPANDTVSEYRIDWGDGTALQIFTAATLPANGIVTHSFASTGPKTVSVTLVDEDGTHPAAGSKVIDVSAPAEVLTVDAGADIGVNEGLNFAKTVTFTDPTDTSGNGRQATVVWGDGQTSNYNIGAGTFAFNISHTYADGLNNYNVSVTVSDDGAQQGVDTFAVNVANVAPTVFVSAAGSVSEGGLYTINLSKSDQGADAAVSYTLHWGDGTADTVLTAAALAAQGGNVTHTYADGNNTRNITVDVVDDDGTWLVAGSHNVFVANVAPLAPVTGADSVNEGAAYALSVGAVVDPGVETRTGYNINWGDGSTSSFTPAEWLAAAGSFSHTYADGAAGRTIIVSATDEDGTFTLGSKSLSVNNVAPTLSINGNASTNEGSVFTLAVAATDPANANDTLSYSIDWGDGSTQNLTAVELAAVSGNVNHVYTDDQDGPVNATPRTISVTVNDGDGGSDTETRSVTVNNVAPTLSASGAATAIAGVSYTLSLTNLVDPGTDTLLANGISVNWGDGSTATYSALGDVTHVYAAASTPTITVGLADEDGSYANVASVAVTVNAPATTVTLDAGADVSLVEGQTFSRTINFSDGQDNGAAGWTYSVDWNNDGTADETGSTAVQSITLNRTFADGASSQTAVVSVTDVAGETASDSFVVSVSNVAPTASVTGADTANEGSSYVLSVGAVTDPGVDTRTGYSINWGDGSTSSFTPAEWLAAAGSFSHTYADGAAAATIVVSTTDEDGTFTLGSKSLTVNNVAPTLVINGNASVNEGSTFTLAVAATDPANANDTLSYSIDWGDGSTQNLTAAQLAAVSGNVDHVYTDDQDGPVNATPRTISVTVNDGDGGSDTETRSVTVNNVAPTLSASGAATVTAGTTYTLSLGSPVDPGADTVSEYRIDWGDGSSSFVAAAGDVTHTYTSAGNRIILVDLVDEDGTFEDVTTVAVQVNAPSATVSLDAGADMNLAEGQTFSRTINFSDGQDNGAAGWTYSVDWNNDGTADETGSTAVQSITLNRTFADGASSQTAVVSVTDVAGETASDSFVINVSNVAPTASVTGADTTNEGSSYVLSVGVISDPGADTRTGYSINWGDGSTSSFTPAEWLAAAGSLSHVYADGAAAATIVVSATDEDGTFTLGSKSLTVNNVAPTLVINGNASVNEGSTFTLAVAATDPANANDTLSYSINWGDGSTQSLTAVQLAAFGGNVDHVYTDDQDGPVNATPRTISVTVSDGDGGSDTETRSVTVNNVAPTLTATGAATTTAGTVYTLALAGLVDPGTDTLLANGISVDWGDGTTSTYSALGDVTHTYAAAASVTIRVSLSDEDGSYANVATLALSVAPGGGGNTNPVADDDAYSVKANTQLTVPAAGFLIGDTDADGDTLSATSITDGVDNGTLTAFPDGSFTYTPNAGFTGVDTFTYAISDGQGGSDTGVVSITVFNAAPVADDDAYSVKANTVLTVPAAGFLIGDTDADGDTLSATSITDGVDNGTLTAFPDGSFTYTPNAGFTGVNTFTYAISDGFGGSDTGVVSITVFNANPVADDDNYVVTAGQTLSVPAAGFLIGDTDADGDTLTATSITDGVDHGTLTAFPDGSFSYTPTAGFTGIDTFSYAISDGFGGSDTGLVTIQVLAAQVDTVRVGDAPVRQTGYGGQWAAAWTNPLIDISHKADYTSTTVAWTAVALHGASSTVLAGGDIYQGDLGVSGKSIASSAVPAELDGKESLRFDLDKEATEVTINLSRFYINDDGGLLVESGLLRLLDSAGNVVAETAFKAGNAAGTQQVSLAAAQGFVAVELLAGAYNGDDFVYGGLSKADGSYGTNPGLSGGKVLGSDFLLDWIEFDFPVIGVPNPDPGG